MRINRIPDFTNMLYQKDRGSKVIEDVPFEEDGLEKQGVGQGKLAIPLALLRWEVCELLALTPTPRCYFGSRCALFLPLQPAALTRQTTGGQLLTDYSRQMSPMPTFEKDSWTLWPTGRFW